VKILLDLNFVSLIAIISSVVLVLYPFVYFGLADHKAKSIAEDFEKIEFALRHFFYVEGFGIISPSSISIKTLVQRYYLSRDPGGDFSIFWIDPDPTGDGKVVAVVVYHGNVDPVTTVRVIRDALWFDEKEKKVEKNYDTGRKIAVIVEVSG